MKADLILVNGVVHTLGEPPQASAVAVAGERILAIGNDTSMRALADQTTEIVDLAGRCLVPGLIDAHLHLAWYGQTLAAVDLDGATSLHACLGRLAAAAGATQPSGTADAWLHGSGWNHNDWQPPLFPDRFSLDAVVPHRPVALTRKDGHSIWVNSLALRLAGITAATPDPAGGSIDRHPESGEPTGILRESAMDLVRRVIPPPGPKEIEAALLRAQQQALAAGLTGVHTMEGAAVFDAPQRLDGAGKLVLRVYQSIPRENLDHAIALGLRTGFGNQRLRLGGVKLFADGSLGSATAAMLEDYEGQPGNRGLITLPKDELRALVDKAVRAGIAPVVHAIGDRANRDVLDVFEEARTADEGRGLRYRIEHAQIVHPKDLPRFALLGVTASMQPSHCPSDRDAAERLWGERCRYAYAWRSLLSAGASLAFGSDCPVESISPLLGLHAAVTRQRPSEPHIPPWYPQECLSVLEALRAYALGAAYACGEEGSRGSLIPGKLADMTVLSRDILRIPPHEIPTIGVEMTIVGGTICYTKERT